MKRAILTLMLGVVAAATAAFMPAAARAQQSFTLSPLVCPGTVPAGEPIVLRAGWVDLKRGWVENFLHAQQTLMIIDGTTVDVSDLYGPLEPASPAGFVTFSYYATGISLSRGETMTIEEQVWLTHKVRGLGVWPPTVAPWGPQMTFFGPGLYVDAFCTITGT